MSQRKKFGCGESVQIEPATGQGSSCAAPYPHFAIAIKLVMPGLVPGIHVSRPWSAKTWTLDHRYIGGRVSWHPQTRA